jgi:20S proteasome alpha/beta subunit
MSEEVSIEALARIVRKVVREELERDKQRLQRELVEIITEGGRGKRRSEGGERQVIIASPK